MTRVRAYTGAGIPQSIEVGGILPKFVTPSDVRDLKNRVDPFVRALDKSVADCKTLPDAARSNWQAFSRAWRAYFDEDDSWLHAAAQMDQGEAYESDVSRWQSMITTYTCAPSAPSITPTAPAATLDDASARRWSGTIKTVAIASAIVAVVIGVRTVMK